MLCGDTASIIIFRVVAKHYKFHICWWYEYLDDRKVLQGKGSRKHSANIVVLVSVIYSLKLHQ